MRTRKELKEIHDKSSYHRDAIEKSLWCGCFYCLNTFRPEEIEEWIDKSQTALCPKCGIDSVLPHEWTNRRLLEEMREAYFLTGVDQNGNEFKIDYGQ